MRLDPAGRTYALRTLTEEQLDVLVVGGGVVGAGAALDAATRGLRVGLVERQDWASGTSSRSSRLAHGGLRYLEHGEIGLVHQALVERGLLLQRLAPHLVRQVPFILPLTRGWERPYVGTGVALYDALSRLTRKGGAMPGHRHLSKAATARLAPGLQPDAYTGAIGFFDAQIDDARHTLAVVRTAAAHGVAAASRVDVTGFLRDGDTVTGVTAVDRLTGAALTIRARVVAGATGVWTGRTRDLLGASETFTADSAEAAPATAAAAAVEELAEVVPSKGVHLVVPRESIALHTALIARTATSVLFLLPWGPTWLVGTTDTPWDGDRDDPTVLPGDVDYLLAEAGRWLAHPLTRADVIGAYAGLRPLLGATGTTQTAKLSREHAVDRPVPGFVEVAGGKYTTYRVMARDLIDAAAPDLPFPLPPSRTGHVLLVGAEGYDALWADRERLAAERGITEPQLRRMLRRYGDEAPEVLDLAATDPRLSRPVHPDAPVTGAEVVRAVTHEGALDVDDVLLRRTRLALSVRGGAASTATEVAALVGSVLGWDADEVAERAQAYVILARERAAALTGE